MDNKTWLPKIKAVKKETLKPKNYSDYESKIEKLELISKYLNVNFNDILRALTDAYLADGIYIDFDEKEKPISELLERLDKATIDEDSKL